MTSRPSDIRISDLANPEHTDLVKGMIEGAAAQPITLSVDAVLAAAAQEGATFAWMDDAYRERMGVILSACAEDPGLSPLGRGLHFSYCVRYVVQRSRLEALYREHPEIAEVEIRRPVIIAGLPRSGTTHMLNLVAVDDRWRSLRYWEAMEPFPSAEEQAGDFAEDPRIERCRQQLTLQEQVMPHFKSMHEMRLDHIEEEVFLQLFDFSTVLMDNYALSTKWRDYYLAMDPLPSYRFLKRALEALQWMRGPERWILKSPQHMERISTLVEVFPDATFVFPHRDPVSVATSMITMMAYTARMSRDAVEPEKIAAYWADRIHRMLEACVRDCDKLPQDRTIHVPFHEFMTDDVAMIERIYATAGQPMTEDVRRKMANYAVDHPRGKHGRIVYDLKGDFGIDPSELYERYAFYIERFGVQREA
ncbi:MAG: sulfotransferase [Deltaproteobacteria bacterium]|nr:sulfotransferase [Deltaproteobacteria bacterium]MBW2362478.1 sulfotransferase [Deltaproteobacteria bacterium]